MSIIAGGMCAAAMEPEPDYPTPALVWFSSQIEEPVSFRKLPAGDSEVACVAMVKDKALRLRDAQCWTH